MVNRLPFRPFPVKHTQAPEELRETAVLAVHAAVEQFRREGGWLTPYSMIDCVLDSVPAGWMKRADGTWGKPGDGTAW